MKVITPIFLLILMHLVAGITWPWEDNSSSSSEDSASITSQETGSGWSWPWQTDSDSSSTSASPTESESGSLDTAAAESASEASSKSAASASKASTKSEASASKASTKSEASASKASVKSEASVSKASTKSEASASKASVESDASASKISSISAASVSSLSSYSVYLTATDGDGYRPYQTDCPSGNILREAKGMSDKEKKYIAGRQAKTNENLIDFLSNRANLSNFDARSFVNNAPQNISIGLAFSGGGYRAMLNGAGQMLALDDRFDDSVEHGLGGLLQSASYVVGLSGGNWLVGSLAVNDWVSVKDIYEGSTNIWDLENTIFNAGGLNVVKTVKYYIKMKDSIEAKKNFGFETTITDVWGRALSSQFFTDDNFGVNMTWSDITETNSFRSHEMPFPIVIANGRTPGTYIISANSTVIEINPYELGSWDPSLNSFSNVKYVGSMLENGTNSSGTCITNFDNAGYIMGTSSSLFNAIIFKVDEAGLPDLVASAFKGVLGLVSKSEVDIANYSPNPFYKSSYGNEGKITSNGTLYLVDGGEDGQNVPYYPLIQNSRNVDVIFGFDNSADTKDNWPNGTSIINTYRRQFKPQGEGTPFPYVPDVETFIEQGFDSKPAFFGCWASNLTDLIPSNSSINATDIPLVVQFSNSFYSYESNTSTFKMSYNNEEKLSIFRNGFEVATRGNLTDDENFAKCIGCAIIRRTQERLGQEQSDECKSCFDTYCWSGGLKDSTDPEGDDTNSSRTGNSSTAGATASGQSASSSSGSTSSESTSSSKKSSATFNKPNLITTIIGYLLISVI